MVQIELVSVVNSLVQVVERWLSSVVVVVVVDALVVNALDVLVVKALVAKVPPLVAKLVASVALSVVVVGGGAT